MPKKKTALQPMHQALMPYPSFDPNDGVGSKDQVLVPGKDPKFKVVVDRTIIRAGKPTRIKVYLESPIDLPRVEHKHVLDALVQAFFDQGKPKDNRMLIVVADLLRHMGRTVSGANYKTFYDAVVRYSKMNITHHFSWPAKGDKKKFLPVTSGRIFIQGYDLKEPLSGAVRSTGWVQFSNWFADSFRDEHSLRYIDRQILAAIDSGSAYRIYESVKKMMGNRPYWCIGILKLAQIIPFYKEMEIKRQIEKIKRAVKDLQRINSFAKIVVEGRGAKAKVMFFNNPKYLGQAKNEIDIENIEYEKTGNLFEDQSNQEPKRLTEHNYRAVIRDLLCLIEESSTFRSDRDKADILLLSEKRSRRP